MTRTDRVESGAGWYVLVWSGEAGLDAWVESNADHVGTLRRWLLRRDRVAVRGGVGVRAGRHVHEVTDM